MKPTKGLNSDVRPSEQIEGTYPFAKNGIQHELLEVVFNEPGFKLMAAAVPYTLMGVIETDTDPILFSTNNTNSAIGIFSKTLNAYTPVLNDGDGTWTLGSARLGFSVNWYITGEAQRNYKGELVCTFTDKKTFPKYLNLDNPSLSSINDLKLFPYYQPPDIDTEVVIGGNLPAGSYYIAVGYEKNDGTSTGYSQVSNFVTVNNTDASQGTTDRAIKISISNTDLNYDFFRIGIISKVNGLVKAVEVTDFIPIGSTLTEYTYTGNEITTDIEVSSILVQPAVYDRVNAIGQLNDAIYLGGLRVEADIDDMQQYASLINLEWSSELLNALNPPIEHVNGIKKGFMHQEVYCFYVRYHKTAGGYTKWFTIPGKDLIAADRANSTEATNGGHPTSVPKYKVEDTIPYFTGTTGGMGKWENDDEVYPDTIDFDSSSLGGRNLRGQKVLHHRFPSIKWCKENLYLTNNEYGKTLLDIIGIKATNINIPSKYAATFNGYEIGYAKRNIGNMTVYGQSLLMHGASDGPTNIFTTGGNFHVTSIRPVTTELTVNQDTFRFHAFDLLFNKPSIEPTFISAQLKLARTLATTDRLEDGGDTAPMDMAITNLIDYTLATGTAIPTKFLRSISNSSYLSISANSGNFININHENAFGGELLGDRWPITPGVLGWEKGKDYTHEVYALKYEEAYLTNLIAVKANIYNSFLSQTIISAKKKAFTDNSVFFNGDTFISDYTFHTYGRRDDKDTEGDGIRGIKIIRRFVCESASNINARYETPGNVYSKWYPNSGVMKNSPAQTYIAYFERSKDPNQFGYSKDFNALNDLTNSTIYSPYKENLLDFPYRIHRGGKLNRQSKPRSWRTFLPLDYYEMQKNMGKIVNLHGMDNKLLIHLEKALFLTLSKSKLETSNLDVILGTGDIFNLEPQPAIDSKLGVGGTIHDLACVNTPIGYVFPDALQGEVYLFKGGLKNMGIGLSIFFREFLKVTGKNCFTGNGITMGWDQKYKRILLTVKNKTLADTSKTVKEFENTAAFWADLTVGDIVNYYGRLVEYKGLNDSIYSCPPAADANVVSWEKSSPVCLQVGGQNTGYKSWALRVRLVNGVADGYSEPNTQGGIGTYFPPELDVASCPLPGPVTTWIGTGAYCVPDVITCPVGYTSTVDGRCIDGGGDYTAPLTLTYTGYLAYATRCRLINGIPDGFCEANSAGANYIAPIQDFNYCPILVEGLLLNEKVEEITNDTTEHTYTTQIIAEKGSLAIEWEALDRPISITIYKDTNSLITTTGWVGVADYAGPWGATLNSPVKGKLLFTAEEGNPYTMVVESGRSNPDNFVTGTYSAKLIAG